MHYFPLIFQVLRVSSVLAFCLLFVTGCYRMVGDPITLTAYEEGAKSTFTLHCQQVATQSVLESGEVLPDVYLCERYGW